MVKEKWEKIKEFLLKNKKQIVIMLIITMVLIVSYVMLWPKPKPPNTILPPVKADERVVAEGIVVPRNYAALSLPVGGVVAEIFVKEGELVKAGQLLVRLANADILAREESARAELSRAKANLAQIVAGSRSQERAMKVAQVAGMKATYDHAKADYDRMQKLFTSGAVAQQQVEQYRAAYLKAKAELDLAQADLGLAQAGSRQEAIAVAQAEVQAAQARLKENTTNYSNTMLTAPFAGTVSYLEIKVGEFIAAGTVVVQLADLTKLQIRTDDLTELSIARVKIGSSVTLTFDAIANLTMRGKVIHIRPYGEKKRGDMTYTVTVEPETLDERLRWNMTAAVTIE